MFDRRHKIKEGKPAISTHDDSKCPMMHVLEGAASLITPDELKSVLSDQDTPTSASSASSSSSRPQSRFPSEESDPASSTVVMRRASENSAYSPDKPMIDAGSSPDYRVRDISGSQLSAVKESMQPHSFSQTTSPLSGYMNSPMNISSMRDVSAHPGAPGLMTPDGNMKFPGMHMQEQVFAHNFEEPGHSPMEDGSLLSYAGPGVQVARGYELSSAGSLPGVNDQESWERFFGQIGFQNQMHVGQMF